MKPAHFTFLPMPRTKPQRLTSRSLTFTKCGVCGTDSACKHYDHDLQAHVCRRCAPAMRDAESVLRKASA